MWKVLLLATVLSGGCVLCKSTTQFQPMPADPRVLYEPGAESLAREVAAALPAAIETVQKRQYHAFSIPVRIYVCASIASFRSYGAPARAAGNTLGKRVFISPKPENTTERIPGIVTHELSHLGLSQRLGLLAAVRNIPPWFGEGLAVFVSGGAGAEHVTRQQAHEALLRGHTFFPEPAGGLLRRHGAADFGLGAHLFYREAALFIEYLHDRDEARFRATLLSVSQGMQVGEAFQSAYAQTLPTLWRDFLAQESRAP